MYDVIQSPIHCWGGEATPPAPAHPSRPPIHLPILEGRGLPILPRASYPDVIRTICHWV